MENNNKYSETIIGYSAFRLFDEYYEYNENACYIADSPESLKEFLEEAMLTVKDYRVDAVKISDILKDYGCSCGEFAMEPEALKRLKQVKDLTYSVFVEPYDNPFNNGEPDLFVVNVGKEKIVPQGNKETRISEILDTFRIFDGVYKREQIDAAVELREEITPHLIKILENVLNDPAKYTEDENLYDHIYSVMLLGHFRESKAHKVIIDLFSLPDDIPDKLFGDIGTSNLPTILLNTCGGSVEMIKAIVLNKDVDDYCRISALNAMAYAVVEGIIPREEVVTIFGSLFTGDETDEMSNFWSLLASFVCNIYPEEVMDTIKQAYEDELIMSGMIRYEDFENALKDGKEKCLERLKIDHERHSLDNIHSSMSWWACFNKKAKPSSLPNHFSDGTYPTYDQPFKKSQNKKAKARKKKHKLAKASKKKNRR